MQVPFRELMHLLHGTIFSFFLDHAFIEKRAFLRRSAGTGIAI